MEDNRRISLCITTFNRVEFTLQSFQKVYNDDRIKEIIIVDDCSEIDQFQQLKKEVEKYPKVKLIRNVTNHGCYINKYIAIAFASCEYAIIFDSDNEMLPEYLDALFSYDFHSNMIYAPDFLMPNFDYTHFGGAMITKTNVSSYSQQPMFDCLINSCNYMVNVKEFCRIFDKEKKYYAEDTMAINYNWLNAGNAIFVVPDMRYNHTVHDKSHYQQYAVQSSASMGNFLNLFKTMS